MSLGLHALLALFLLRGAIVPAARPPTAVPIEIALEAPHPAIAPVPSPSRSTASARERSPHRALAGLRRSEPVPARPAAPESRTAPAQTPGTTSGAGATSGTGATSGAGTIDLFSRSALDRLVVSPPGAGGTTRRAGDGLPPPGAHDEAADRAALEARVAGWMDQLSGQERVASGRVPPAWRSTERRIDAGFHPTVAEITDDGRLRSLGRQLVRALGTPPRSPPLSRAADPSVEARLDSSVPDQIAASQRTLAEPGEWRRVEIELTVGADGQIESLRVVTPSGRSALDGRALEAVRRAIAAHPVRDPRGPVRARFAVDAAVEVTPPTVNPLVDPVTGRTEGATVPLFGLRFDANFRSPEIDYPLRRRVRTRVALLSLTALR